MQSVNRFPAHPAEGEPFLLACVGLSGFESDTLDAYFRLVAREAGISKAAPCALRLTGSLEQAHLILANADTAGAVRQVAAAGRLGDTLFLGGPAPPVGARTWLPRPVDALQIHRTLTALIQRRERRSLQTLMGAGRRDGQPSGRARQQALDHATVQDFQRSTGYSNSVLAEGDARLDAVLVVSASPAERRLLRERLRGLGYRVSVVADGDTAVTAAQRRSWRFIFLGVALSPADPYQLCRRLKQLEGPRRPVLVMVCAQDRATDHIRATFAGCDAWVPETAQEIDLLPVLARHDATLERVFEPTAPMSL